MASWINPNNFAQSVTNGVSQSGPITTAQGGTGSSSASTGTGGVVLASTPTLVTPILGTPTSVNLTNATNVPLGAVSGTLAVANGGTGSTTASTGTGGVVLATSPTLVTPVLGTPTSVNLTNATNVPMTAATGTLAVLHGGTGVTTSTGTGAVVLGTTPTLVTPILGTPTSVNLTNATNVPLGAVSGTLAVANGGTGAGTVTAAFDALSPLTTGGDLLYGGAAGTGLRLANGSAGQVLASQGTTLAPQWVSVSSVISYSPQTLNGTPIALNFSSPANIYFTSGSTATTVTLPTVASGNFGFVFKLANVSATAGTLSINVPTGPTLLVTIGQSTSLTFTAIAVGGTAASWAILN